MFKHHIFYFIFLGALLTAFTQNESDESALIKQENGLFFEVDSLYLLNVRFRMQNRMAYFNALDEANEAGFEMRVRRLRLRLDGYLIQPKISYYVQLSFSRGDQDLHPGVPPNIVRDAMVYYTVNKYMYLGFGQSKLPGNRQRVISSGNLQMPDRSIANQLFNLDRDYGFFSYTAFPIKQSFVNIKTAVSSGEGRNQVFTDLGLAYTGRVEYLPFGKFTNTGDYSEGDLEYETQLKLSLGASYSYNHRAIRSGGQVGAYMALPVDLETTVYDIHAKYKGFALMAEYFVRNVYYFYSNNQNSLWSIPQGEAINVQISKVLWRKNEIAYRYTQTQAPKIYANTQSNFQTHGINFSSYFNQHRVKAQNYFGIDQRSESANQLPLVNRFTWLFQIEFGI